MGYILYKTDHFSISNSFEELKSDKTLTVQKVNVSLYMELGIFLKKSGISLVTRPEHIYFMLYIDVIGDQQSIGHTLPNTIFQKLALIEYSQSEKLSIFNHIRFGLSDGIMDQLNFLKTTKFVIDWLKSQPNCSKMNEVMVSQSWSVRFQ